MKSNKNREKKIKDKLPRATPSSRNPNQRDARPQIATAGNPTRRQNKRFQSRRDIQLDDVAVVNDVVAFDDGSVVDRFAPDARRFEFGGVILMNLVA